MMRIGFNDCIRSIAWISMTESWEPNQSTTETPSELSVSVEWLTCQGDFNENLNVLIRPKVIGSYKVNNSKERYDKAMKNWNAIYESLLTKGYATEDMFDKELFEMYDDCLY